jgi:bifunctional non-homologous end joining protein LigD
LAQYYATIGEWMLPHLAGRPLTLVRCPNGWDSKCFYQKKVDDNVPAALTRVRIGDGSIYMMAESVAAIVTLLQMGVLEIHPWGSQAKRLDRPDRIVLDLDPDEGLPWADVKQAVLLVKALLENLELSPYLKSTGGKGLHVVVPLEPRADWEQVKGFTKAVAELLERTFPDRFTSKLLKVSRGGRIFIDYLRNAEGATAVAAYSLRAKAGAPVSTPLAWSELGKDVRFAHFNARTVPKRLAKLKSDPWKDLAASARPLTPAVMARVGYKPG